MRYWDGFDWLLAVTLTLMATLPFIFGIAVYALALANDDLMRECMADGHARYHCVSILRGGRA